MEACSGRSEMEQSRMLVPVSHHCVEHSYRKHSYHMLEAMMSVNKAIHRYSQLLLQHTVYFFSHLNPRNHS